MRGERVVDQDRRPAQLRDPRPEGRDHAVAQVRRRVGLAKGDQAAIDDLGAESAGEFLELVELDLGALSARSPVEGADDQDLGEGLPDGGIGAGQGDLAAGADRHRVDSLRGNRVSRVAVAGCGCRNRGYHERCTTRSRPPRAATPTLMGAYGFDGVVDRGMASRAPGSYKPGPIQVRKALPLRLRLLRK